MTSLPSSTCPSNIETSDASARRAAVVPPPPPAGFLTPPAEPTDTIDASTDPRVQPLAVRFQPSQLRRQRLRELWHAVPCWLSSLLLHLSLVVLLGCLVSPVRVARLSDALMLEVSLAESDQPHNESDDVTQIETASLDTEIESSEPAADSTTTAPIEKDEPEEEESITPEPRESPALKPLIQIAQVFRAFQAQTAEPVMPTDGEDSLSVDLPTQQEYDQIVEDFILYDIGRLPGEKGRAAKRRFDEIGPASVPALVRGLNRSASIQATCPVCVISSKLIAALAKNNDPSALEYALDNIARDVPKDAPHRDRITNLRNGLAEFVEVQRKNVQRLAAEQAQREKLRAERRDALAARGFLADDAVVERYMKLRNERPEVLAQTLANRDEESDVRSAAAIAIAEAQQRWGDEAVIVVGRAAAAALLDGDAKLRHNAHVSLVALANGKDCGAADVSSPVAREAVSVAWHDWLYEFKLTQVYRKQSAAQLRMARQLARLGKRDKAAARYRQIVKRFPNTEAADLAQAELDAR